MYVESREKFNWFDFFAKAAIIVVFVFLLMWIIPLPGVKKVEVKVDKLEDQINIITDRVFYDNLENMKESAKDYFTIPKLPKKVGDSTKLTLKEMLDKKLILNFTDKDGNSCDTDKSYVEIKRLENEYELKTYLKCGKTEDYIISYLDLECNLSCNNDCKLTEQEVSYNLYQYKKTITQTGWTSWSSWTTEKKKADDTRTKTQYKGKKWIENLVYEYEHTKTTKEEDKTVTTKEEDKVVSVWVPGETKTCEKEVKVPYTVSKTCEREVEKTEKVCKKVAVGTKTVRDCATCAIKTVTIYETVCENQVVKKTETYDCSYTAYRTEKQSYDCSTEGYFKRQTIEGQTITTVIPGESKTETIWTKNEKESDYIATGKKRIKEDKGYFVYTENWQDKLPAGYTKTETRTLYSYRNKTTQTKTIYTWSRNANLGNGWELIKTETKTEKVSSK